MSKEEEPENAFRQSLEASLGQTSTNEAVLRLRSRLRRERTIADVVTFGFSVFIITVINTLVRLTTNVGDAFRDNQSHPIVDRARQNHGND